MINDGVPLETLRARLATAQAAYDQVCLGEKPTTLGLGDKNLGFAATSKERLAEYIAELQQAIQALENPSAVRRGYSVAKFVAC